MNLPRSFSSRSLKALIIYRNFLYLELVRSVHVYQNNEGLEENVEREFLFYHDKNYEEHSMGRIFTNVNFKLEEHFEGRKNGVWDCIFKFDRDTNPNIDSNAIPSILSVTSNPKLAHIRNLADDLEFIIHQAQAHIQTLDINNPSDSPTNKDNDDQYGTSPMEEDNGERNGNSPMLVVDEEQNNTSPLRKESGQRNDISLRNMIGFDLNMLPPSDSEDEEINLNGPS